MKFPSIIIRKEECNLLMNNDFHTSVVEQVDLPLLSSQDLNDAEVNLFHDSILMPPEMYLKYIFLKRHDRSEYSYYCTSSEENISDDDQLIEDLKESLTFANELKEFLSDFIILMKSPGFHRLAESAPDCLDPEGVHEYERLVGSISLVNSISDKYLQYGYLDHQFMTAVYLQFRELHGKNTFIPVPYFTFDNPEIQISALNPLTVAYKGKGHNQSQFLDDIYNDQVGCRISFYRIQYDTQPALSILDYLSRNSRHTKRCPVCGRQFIVSKYRKKYCSEECRNNIELKTKQNFPTQKNRRREINYRQRFNKAYDRFHAQSSLADFDLKKLNIPEPEQRGTSAQRQELSKKRRYIVNTLDSCCKRYNRKGFHQAINELISYQQLRRDWGFISRKEYEDWLDNSKISSNLGRKPLKK